MNELESLLNLPRLNKGSIDFDKYKINYTDSLSVYWELKDIFESEIYNFSTNNTEPVILDAGGCVGVATLYFKKLYPDAKITVFEPDTDLFSTLSQNIANNKLSDVTLVNSGVGKEAGTVNFFADGVDGGSIYEGINDNKLKVLIDVCRLSEYMDQRIDLLKMNIEGMESEVFEEIESKLSNVNEIIFEYHAFAELPQSLGNILNILDRNNFKYVVTDATNAKIPVPFNLSKNYRFFNLVYAKNFNRMR